MACCIFPNVKCAFMYAVTINGKNVAVNNVVYCFRNAFSYRCNLFLSEQIIR